MAQEILELSPSSSLYKPHINPDKAHTVSKWATLNCHRPLPSPRGSRGSLRTPSFRFPLLERPLLFLRDSTSKSPSGP